MRRPQLLDRRWLTIILRSLRELIQRFDAHDGLKTASALTYTTLFAVVPFMTVLYAMLSAIPSFQGISEQLQALIFSQFVPATGSALVDHLRDFSRQARSLTLIGLIFLLVTAVMMMVTVERAFNSIWHVSRSRRGVSSFLLYWAVLTLGPLLLGSGFLLSSYLASLTLVRGAAEVLGGPVAFLRLLPLTLSFMAFVFIYMAVPNCRVRFRHAVAGAGLAALALELAKGAFSLYVTYFPSYQVIYGTFAAVPLFLVWVFLSWAIVLVGAELAAWLGERRRAEWRYWAPFWQALGVVSHLYEAHRRGQSVYDRELAMRLGARYSDVMAPLQTLGVAVQLDNDRWMLGRDLGSLSLWDFQRAMPWAVPLGESSPAPEMQAIHAALQEAERHRQQVLTQPMEHLLAEGARNDSA
ncbi:YihY family inner membrane protein [Chromohalobacter israelensis]|uniref:YihY family inner membrane protein n=1 Tax=Chromohalobacter israelensis TaxID=141390 RepID=UPI00054FDF96|nr:YihY family inner membrane protein [Chromohalobacter israelensis]MDF9434406.1 YihY family inner membrane protein [Chromohalobacter israelensis]